MPYRKKSRKRRRKFRARRSRKKSSLGVLVNKTLSVLPDKYLCRMKYSVMKQLQAGAAFAHQEFSFNGITDIEGGNEKPMGFNEVGALYDKYRVTASSITVRFANEATTALTLVMFPINTQQTFTTYGSASQQQYSKKRTVARLNGAAAGVLKHYMTSTGLAGKKINQDPSFEAVILSQPVVEMFWILFWQSMDNLTNLNVNYSLEIQYYVTWFDRVNLAVS